MNDRVLMTKNELTALSKYALLAKSSILEIGTFRGGATEILARATPDIAVWSIDVYGVPEVHTIAPNRIYGDYLINLNNAFLIVGLAERIAKYWNTELGMLILDGEHENKSPIRDFHDWAKFIIPKGYLIFHDAIVGKEYESLFENRNITGFPDVWDAVQYAKNNGYSIVDQIDTMIILQKD